MVYEIGTYQYPGDKRADLWVRCPRRSCTVYLYFPEGRESDLELGVALKAAIEKDTCAIKVTRKCPESALGDNPQYSRLRDRLVLVVCEFKSYIPHFNSDFVAVDHDELVDVKQLTDNIKVVSFRQQQFVYKFITPGRSQNSFETEVENYKKLADVPGIPHLTAVVRKEGLIQGLLMSYIEGLDLWSAVTSGVLC